MANVDWVTVVKFANDIGMTPDAVAKKVGHKANKDECWPEFDVWIKLDRILISRSGWDRWVETALASRKQAIAASRYNSSTKVSPVENELKVSPQPITLTE